MYCSPNKLDLNLLSEPLTEFQLSELTWPTSIIYLAEGLVSSRFLSVSNFNQCTELLVVRLVPKRLSVAEATQGIHPHLAHNRFAKGTSRMLSRFGL